MSFKINYQTIKDLDLKDHLEDLMNAQLKIQENTTQYVREPCTMKCYKINNSELNITLPIRMLESCGVDFKGKNPNESDFKKSLIDMDFNAKLYTTETDPKKYRDQNVVAEEAYKILKSKFSCFFQLPTGFGKTTMGTYFSSKLGKKTLVLCFYSIVNEQWDEKFKESTNAKTHLFISKKPSKKVWDVDGMKTPLNPTADVYIMGMKKCANFIDKYGSKIFDDIGTVIIDEAHVSTKECFTKILLNIHPNYLIGLSATPIRYDDGLHKLFVPYFGDMKTYISRFETKPFKIMCIKTRFAPKTYYNEHGKRGLNWTKMMTNLYCENEERSALIAQLISDNCRPGEKILVLSSRVKQNDIIANILTEKHGRSVMRLYGKYKEYNKRAPHEILIAGIKKAGCGFDGSQYVKLFLISSIKHIQQCEGRIRCHNNVIFDIVDKHPAFDNHWEIREEWYEKRGAIIDYIKMK